MNIDWLQDFLALEQTRSFSKAAKARHVTQSALSRRIQALEQWLGYDLLDRSTQPLGLSTAGEAFLQTAQRTVEALWNARRKPETGGLQAPIRIAAMHTLALHYVPRLMLRLARDLDERPRVHALALDYGDCTDALNRGEADFTLTYEMLDSKTPPTDARAVVDQDALIYVASPLLVGGDTRVAPDTDLPRVAHSEASFLGRAERKYDKTLGTPVYTSALSESIRVCAREGLGAGWLPAISVAEDVKQGTLERLRPPGDEIPLAIVLRRSTQALDAAALALWRWAGRASVDS